MGSTGSELRYFFSTGTLGTLEKSTGTAVPAVLFFNILAVLGTFAKSSVIKNNNKKGEVCTIAPVHLPQQSFERFVFKIQCCQPIKRGNRKVLLPEKDILKQKRSGLSDDHFQMLLRQFRIKLFQ